MNKSVIINTPDGRLICSKIKDTNTFIIEIHREIDSAQHKFQVMFTEITNANMIEFRNALNELMQK